MSSQIDVQPETELRCLDFACIRWTDGAHGVAVMDGSLKEIHLAVKFHELGCVNAGVETNGRQNASREQALVAEIVNRKQHARAHVRRVAMENASQINRHQRGLPIVAMDDIGTKEMAHDS